MRSASSLEFRIARDEAEFQQIHRLNYRTFVEEIPQHRPAPARVRIDEFHDQNTYAVCLDGERLVGMIAVRGRRPFSLDRKLPDLDAYLPGARSVCELRLLSIEKEYRRGLILFGLIEVAAAHCARSGYDLAVISGTTRQQKLFRHVGFVGFGPLVGTAGARFQPMYLTLDAFRRKWAQVLPSRPPDRRRQALNFLPGPVASAPAVIEAFAGSPVSHRGRGFVEDLKRAKKALCDLVGAREVEILLGSGTLANDAVAAQLSMLSAPGLLLVNGEFGRRLVDHATRFGLSFEVVELDWGEVFDEARLEASVEGRHDIEWVWTVHCETSTGVLNDIDALQRICGAGGLKLCLDCISSIGTVPVSLRDVYLASGVSSKGLASYAGLCCVFHNHRIAAAARIPRYLDLGLYASADGVPFTQSSNLLHALQAALGGLAEDAGRFDEVRRISTGLRAELRDAGFGIVAADDHASPAVITIQLPASTSSHRIGTLMEEAGFHLSYRSEYLLARNWIQICLMGCWSASDLADLTQAFEKTASLRSTPSARQRAGRKASRTLPGS